MNAYIHESMNGNFKSSIVPMRVFWVCVCVYFRIKLEISREITNKKATIIYIRNQKKNNHQNNRFRCCGDDCLLFWRQFRLFCCDYYLLLPLTAKRLSQGNSFGFVYMQMWRVTLPIRFIAHFVIVVFSILYPQIINRNIIKVLN